jgi:hypothetical protein
VSARGCPTCEVETTGVVNCLEAAARVAECRHVSRAWRRAVGRPSWAQRTALWAFGNFTARIGPPWRSRRVCAPKG